MPQLDILRHQVKPSVPRNWLYHIELLAKRVDTYKHKRLLPMVLITLYNCMIQHSY